LISSLPNIKKVFIGSGVRYDMITGKKPEEDSRKHYSDYFKRLVTHHVSGRLKVAPEHTSARVLEVMRKPDFSLFEQFKEKFLRISEKAGLQQQIIPYFISSHPGCSVEDMMDCALEIKKTGIQPEQVQDLTPTPMTLSSVMYYTGIDPYTGKRLHVAKTTDEKKQQKLMFFWYLKENKAEIIRLLRKHNKGHLIGKMFRD
jgi:uncharacterized radical SAM protein YgiQ